MTKGRMLRVAEPLRDFDRRKFISNLFAELTMRLVALPLSDRSRKRADTPTH